MRVFSFYHFIKVIIGKVSLLKALIIFLFVVLLFIFISNRNNQPAPPIPTSLSMMPGVLEIEFASSNCDHSGEEFVSNTFVSRETTCIYFRFDQDRTGFRNPYDYLLRLELYKDTGATFMDFEEEQHLDAISPQFNTSLRVGIDVPGYWPPGTYYAYVSIDGKLYAQGNYEILGPQ